MSFGFTNAPHHFRRRMNFIMQGIDGLNLYVDDIHLESDTVDGLLQILEKVVRRLIEHEVSVNVRKFQLGTEVKVLGMVRTAEGLKADPSKLRN